MTTSDIEAAIAELKGKGVTFSMEVREARPGVRFAFLNAPDGLRIELLERPAA